MLDVTDAALRRVMAAHGKPDVLFTEFVSADGLCSKGKEALLPMLWFSDAERPVVAQIFSSNPGHIREASELVRELGFDGVDINMGCPDRNVVKQGAGAALIRTPKLAREIIRAAKEGAGPLPVSIKTRTGDTTDTLETWLPELLAEEPAAITIHARTRKDLSKVPARWENIRQAVEIRDHLGSKTLIIGNGDVRSIEEGIKRAEESGCDGVMAGRGVLGNPWFFATPPHTPTREEKLRVLIEHTKLFEELFRKDRDRPMKNFDVIKKHYRAYVEGWRGAKELRTKLMGAKNVEEVERIIAEHPPAS